MRPMKKISDYIGNFEVPTANSVLWTLLLVVGTAGVFITMLPSLDGKGYTGGTYLGISYGILGFSCILFTLLYLIRKDLGSSSNAQKSKARTWVTNTAFKMSLEQILYSHVIIGVLSLVLITGHSGFRLQNHVAVIAYLFLILTVISGIIGLFIIYILPKSQVRNEAHVLIPSFLCQRISDLHEEISELSQKNGGVFLELYNELVIPLYNTDVGKDPLSADVSPWADKLFADPDEVSEELSEDFMNLAVKIEEVHDLLVLLGRHMKFRWMIRGWLMLHIPSTLGLLIFSGVHLISVFWFGVHKPL